MASPAPTAAADQALHVRASNASKAAIETIAPMCAEIGGVSARVDYANNPAIAKEIADGATFDVVVIEAHMLDSLAERGFVARDSVRPLAAIEMGLATREAGPDPRIDSIRAFRRALLSARSIGYAGDGHSGMVFLQVIDRLGLKSRLGDRLVPFTGAYAGAAEASARLQFVAAPFTLPLPAPLRLVGHFPTELNAQIDVATGVARTASPAAASSAACLASPSARAIFKRAGYRLAGPR